MPIYEYECTSCGQITSALIFKPREEDVLRCSHCFTGHLVRIPSRCAVHKTETQRVDEFDPAVPRDGSFYKDDRHVGLWAKKRLKQLGVDLGPKFDETVEVARSGKFPKSELT